MLLFSKMIILIPVLFSIYTGKGDIITTKTMSLAIVQDVSYSEEDIMAIAQTLAGECYDDQLEDKELVAEVIVNRVSDGRFGDTIYDVVTAKNQFLGYYRPLREPSNSDIQIAKDILSEWHDKDCEALSEYVYFSAGSNGSNIFRKEG